MYVVDGQVTYFDNHAGCDASGIEAHLRLVVAFFAKGEIPTLGIESCHGHVNGESACMVATVKYTGRVAPLVRASFMLEREGGQWRIRHIHFSDDPNDGG